MSIVDPILEQSSISRPKILKLEPSASQTHLTTIKQCQRVPILDQQQNWLHHLPGAFIFWEALLTTSLTHIYEVGFLVFCLPTANQTPPPTLLLIYCPFLLSLLHLGHKLILRSCISSTTVSLIPQT